MELEEAEKDEATEGKNTAAETATKLGLLVSTATAVALLACFNQ